MRALVTKGTTLIHKVCPFDLMTDAINDRNTTHFLTTLWFMNINQLINHSHNIQSGTAAVLNCILKVEPASFRKEKGKTKL